MCLNNKLSILVCSCDSYSDVWHPFFFLLDKYWPNLNINVILNTESKCYECNGESFSVSCHNMFSKKNVTYGKRIIKHIEKIHTPYTLLLMDDFFLREKVDVDFITKVVSYFDLDPKAASFNFEYSFDQYDLDCAFPEFKKRPKYGLYKLSFQASIWKTKVLKKMWKKHENPWEWEEIGNYRTYNNKYNFYVLKRGLHQPINYGYNLSGSGIQGGKWVKNNVYNLFKEEHIEVDFNKRGFYLHEQDERRKGNGCLVNNIRMLRSWGFLRFLRITIVRLYLKYKNNSATIDKCDYTQFKRQKYYQD